jgi:phospholipid/cholesterol/gamma-HCH transport system substrate-binding protein
METRARYVLIGLFTLAVIVFGFFFVTWLEGTGLRDRAVYRVRFESSVSGLLTGSAVLFNGVRVGEVTEIVLGIEDPREVTATIAVAPGTPVRADTQVGLDFGGLMGGTAAVSLTGGTPRTPILASPPGQPPLLVADAASAQTMTQTARETLRRIDALVAENADALHGTLANLNTFSQALARNSDRVDGILAGLERMTGGAAAKPMPSYGLSASRAFPGTAREAKGQIVVPEPTALVALETQKILIRLEEGGTLPLENGQWSDSLPKLVQAKIVQSFENANYLRVSRPFESLAADFQLLVDIREFQLSSASEPVGEIEFAAKILGQDGRILDARIFRAAVPAKAANAPAAAAALDQAFGKAATELVVWVAGAI